MQFLSLATKKELNPLRPSTFLLYHSFTIDLLNNSNIISIPIFIS